MGPAYGSPCGHCGSIVQPSWVRKHHGALRYYTCAKKVRTGYPGLSIHREGQAVVVHIPMRFRRRNGRQMIVMAGQQPPDMADGEKPTGPKRQAQPEGNQTLIKAIAKAHHWQEQLESGKHASIDDLAQTLKVDRTYVSRMLRLALLAPDIIEAILRGDEPDSLSLRKLQKDPPMCWGEQRERWRACR